MLFVGIVWFDSAMKRCFRTTSIRISFKCVFLIGGEEAS